MDPLSILTLVGELIKMAVDLGTQIYTSATADAQAIAQRLQDAKATLAGQKTQAHADLDARWAQLQAELATLKAGAVTPIVSPRS